MSAYGIKEKEVLLRVPKTARTEVQVSRVTTVDGQRFIDIRNCYTTQAEPDVLKYSKSGIRIPEAMVGQIAAALSKLD